MRARIFALLLAVLSVQDAASATPLPSISRLDLPEPLRGAQPSVALEKGRGFIVTWQQSDGPRSSLHWMSLDFDGRPTSEGVISSGDGWFVNWADTPAMTVLDNGDWVAFWLERNDPHALEGYDIKVVRSEDRGRTWSKPVSPHRDRTKTQHGFVSLVADGDDRVVIAWLDGRRAEEPLATRAQSNSHDHESAPMTLRAAVLDRANEIVDEALIDERTCSCCQTDLVRTPNETLIAYRDRSAGEIRDIAISRRRDHRWSEPELVHQDGWRIEGCPVNGPALAINGDRGLVFWPTLVGEAMTLRYKLFPATSAPVARSEMQTLMLPNTPSGRVDAAAWRNGFLLTWVSRARERPSVDMAVIDARGSVTLAPALAEPALRGRATGFPRIASDGVQALVVWPESENGVQVIGLGLIR